MTNSHREDAKRAKILNFAKVKRLRGLRVLAVSFWVLFVLSPALALTRVQLGANAGASVVSFVVMARLRVLRVFAVLFLIAACSNIEANLEQVRPGLSKQEVRDLLGEPDQAFVAALPEGYFFGPQEGLVDLLPAGAGYEEWIYEIGDDDFYVWFSGEQNSMENWQVILTARFPRDAVF